MTYTSKSGTTRRWLAELEADIGRCEAWVDGLLLAVSEEGDLTRYCCEQDLMPGATIRWMKADTDRKRRYEQAQGVYAELLMHGVVGIADGQVDARGVVTGDIGRDKLRIDTRMKLAARLLPEKFGDRTILSDDRDRPLLGFSDRAALVLETARAIHFMLAQAGRKIDGEVVDAEEVVPKIGGGCA